MCGLSGVLLYPRRRSEAELERIREISTANLVFNEERGREAAGVAVIQADGTYHILKRPVPASTLVKSDAYRRLLATINEETVCILGHTRMPTKGSPLRNVNNHPLRTEHVIGIHNGMILNDDDLFARFHFPRAGEVDSEIIFRLLDTVDPAQNDGRYPQDLEATLRFLRGTYAVLAVDLRRPTNLLALKQLRPLCLHYELEWEALFFSSRYLFLRKAFGRAVITEALESGYGYCFDALRLPALGNRPAFVFPLAGGDEKERSVCIKLGEEGTR